MDINTLAHADSLEMQAMFSSAASISDMLCGEEMDEFEREMSRLEQCAAACTPDPRPENF